MDDQEFKRKLSEVAEWRIPDTITDTVSGTTRKRRGRPTKDTNICSDTEEHDDEDDNDDTSDTQEKNNTFPPQITKLKVCAQTCEDCGRHCENGRQIEKRVYDTNNKRHWRQRCLNCDHYQNPYTGEFDLPRSTAAKTWNDFHRSKKHRSKNTMRLTTQLMSVVDENDKEIIRIADGLRISE